MIYYLSNAEILPEKQEAMTSFFGKYPSILFSLIKAIKSL